jgi:hypothetical protein
MASKSRAAKNSSINQIVVAVRESAERIIGSAQYTVVKAKDDGINLATKFAQQNLLALAGRADQVSVALTELSAKLERAPKFVAAKRRPAAKRVAAKAAPKAAPKATRRAAAAA